MRVWRVAHRKHKDRNGFPSGPYTSGGVPEDIADAFNEMRYAHCDDRHPSPYWDRTLTGIGDAEHCAFNSLYALNAWFEHEWRVLLFAHDFAVYEYDVPEEHARTGEFGQTLFNRNHVTLISTTDITD